MEFGDLAFRFALGAVVIVGLLYAIRPRRVFSVVIDQGAARITGGAVPREFVREVHTACTQAGVARAKVDGVRWGKHVVLSFSRSIPPDCRQRIRNLWQIRQLA